MQKTFRTSLNLAANLAANRAAILGLILFILAASSVPTAAAPATQEPQGGVWPSLILRAGHVDGGSNVRVLPPREFLRSQAKTATIVVNYLGYWDPAAKTAFEFAKGIWEAQMSSPLTITVDAYWEDLNYISPNVLGGASAIDYRANFTGAPVPDTWYPLALANRLAGTDLDPVRADIEASFNCSFPGWYFGTDGNPSTDEYDFTSVVLHEIGHGLGFSGSMQVIGQTGSWGAGTGMPVIYDRFVVNGSMQSLLSNFANNSTALAGQLKSNNLFFFGTHAMAANVDNPPKLYAPATWQQGSSYSHLDENTYKVESGNALMTPSLMNGEVLQDPGPIAMGIFNDIGWSPDIDLAVSYSTPGSLNATPVSLSQLISRNSPAQRTYSCQTQSPSPSPSPSPAPKGFITYLPAVWNLPSQ